MACAVASGSSGSSARAHRRVPLDQGRARSERPVQPRQDRRSAEDGRRRAVPLRAASAPAPYRTIALVPVLDWSAWDVQNDPRTEAISAPGTGGDSTGGFAKAVEMCNNNGHCRKFDAGTMCPSFRVTRDEQHVTRGRANTLAARAVGPARHGRIHQRGGEGRAGSLRLCKGCKRECPTGVDMARMKIEFLAQHAKRHGHSLKDRLSRTCPTTRMR